MPLVFVHGAWHAAWCWEENFLGYFADRGYHAVAVNLRGHGGRPARQSLNRCSIADYVGDVGEVADRLSVAPVVIGHSMGGLIVQKYLETRRAPAGVLLASVPTRGATGFLLRWARQHPWKVTKSAVTRNSLSLLDTEEAVRDRFFSATTPDEVVAQCADRLQEESSRASWDGALLNLPRPKRITAPLLVMGAEQDGCFTTAEVHATARAYRTKAEIFPGMGHDMMLEPAWPTVAERIDAWLVSNGL
ncbi:alpha/beta hydrolase [Mycolicibacterium hodleri]|uniref:alpha/beta hydrolase n=1 Tax=Mycolicibacterium hodleri TaxID=49897 RepID=UPI003183C93D